MPTRVVDASVFAASHFREPRQREAERIIAGGGLFAPTLVKYEMANIACKKIELSPQRREFIATALQAFLNLHIDLREVDCQRVVELATLTGLTAYDASYLFVARELGMPLLTFDRQLARVARIWRQG